MCDKVHYDQLDERVTNLEGEVAELRNETRNGFATVNTSIATLSQQLSNMDRRLINDREKWHDVFRSVVKWTVRAGIVIITYAAGANITRTVIVNLFK